MPQSSFQDIQRDFAKHLRDPNNSPAPFGIEDRRMAIYRELFFNNVKGFLEQGFPVLHRVLSTEEALRLARHFFASHTSHTPYFLEIPQEFVTFLAEQDVAEKTTYPFLLELAHYEWMELVLDASTASVPSYIPFIDGIALADSAVMSPVYEVVSYQYPVHKISADFQPDTPLPQPVWLLVYRNAEFHVRFMEINAPTARLLQLLNAGQEERQTIESIIHTLADEMQFADLEKMQAFSLDILKQMHERGILLGKAESVV